MIEKAAHFLVDEKVKPEASEVAMQNQRTRALILAFLENPQVGDKVKELARGMWQQAEDQLKQERETGGTKSYLSRLLLRELHIIEGHDQTQLMGDLLRSVVRGVMQGNKLQEFIREVMRLDQNTLLYNRKALLKDVGQMLISERAEDHVFSIIMVDMDHFKQINDTYGHRIGDKVIAAVSEILKRSSREKLVYRYGGEEFTLIVKGGAPAAEAVIKRLVELLKEKPVVVVEREGKPGEEVRKEEIRLTASIGWISSDQFPPTMFAPPGSDVSQEDALLERASTLLDMADQAQYEAKKTRDTVVRYKSSYVPDAQDDAGLKPQAA